MQRALRILAAGAALALAGSVTDLSAQVEIPENSPDTVQFTGPEMGTVTFAHVDHQDRTECTSCHHESRDEMPLTEEYQSCLDCHTAEPTAPMTTSLRDAFHDRRADEGVCVDCHIEAKAEGKDAPERCRDCHVRGR